MPALAPLNMSTPNAGSRWMRWRSSRGSRWRKTCARPARSSRARWRTLTTSTRLTSSAKVKDLRRYFTSAFECRGPSTLNFTFLCRSAETAGGTATHGRGAQSGDAKEEGDAVEVLASVWLEHHILLSGCLLLLVFMV